MSSHKRKQAARARHLQKEQRENSRRRRAQWEEQCEQRRQQEELARQRQEERRRRQQERPHSGFADMFELMSRLFFGQLDQSAAFQRQFLRDMFEDFERMYAFMGAGGNRSYTGGSTIVDDPYKILALERNATTIEVKSAFHKRIMTCHPDLLANLPADEKTQKEEEAKRLIIAYHILCDEEKRRRFDRYGRVD